MDGQEQTNMATTPMRRPTLAQTSNQVTKQSPLSQATTELEGTQMVLLEELLMLSEQLRPVLSSERPTDAQKDVGEMPDTSDVTAFIQRTSRKNRTMISVIRDLRERLEV